MTPEPPSRPAGRTRPDRDLRRRSLGIDALAGASPEAEVDADRPSLTEALATIPDLRSPAVDDEPIPAAPVTDDLFVARDEPLAVPSPVRTRTAGGAAPPVVPWWRRAGFAISLVVLVGAIPLLGREGYRIIARSTDGRLVESSSSPAEPGYEELVVSTPTAAVVQTDSDGTPVSLTVIALTADTGGTMIFVPLDTKVVKEGFGVDRLRTAFSMRDGAPARARAAVVKELASVLNIGIDQTIELDNRGFSQALAAVGPLPIDNPAPMDLGGFPFAAGPVELGPDLVGSYLAYTYEGEDQLSQFVRQEAVWRSWLAAVAESDDPQVVPGETTSGLGLFVRTLAAGPVNYVTLPGQYLENGRYEVDAAALNEVIVAAVPIPDAAQPGSRAVVRVLNGVEPGPPPMEVTRAVTRYGGTLTVVGNGPEFGRDQTDIVYRDRALRGQAELLLAALGGTGEAILDEQASDSVDITVILGSDVLDDPTAVDESPAPTTDVPTTVPSGGT